MRTSHGEERGRPAPLPAWTLLAALAVGLTGLGVVVVTADHPTLAWRKFVAVVAASLCYLSVFRLLRLRR